MHKLETILKQLEKLDERLLDIDKTLVKQEANLAEHMRRTAILETKLEKTDGKVAKITQALLLGAGACTVYYWSYVRELLRIFL